MFDLLGQKTGANIFNACNRKGVYAIILFVPEEPVFYDRALGKWLSQWILIP